MGCHFLLQFLKAAAFLLSLDSKGEHFTFAPNAGEGNGNPPAVFLPGKFHGQRSLVGYIQSIGLQRVGHDLATKQRQQPAEGQSVQSLGEQPKMRDKET